jgi:hyperosmotically inducible protein
MKQASFAIVLSVVISCGVVERASSQPLRSSSQAKTPEKPADTLARSVHHQIQVLPFYSVFDNIESRVDGNRVTLTGQVLRPTLKASAEAAVKDIEGVGTVSNQIEVLPFSESDDGLRGDIYRVLFENDELKRYASETMPAIHIIVKNGNVVLEGWVQSDSDKRLAGMLSGSVSNSKSLQNHLVVRQK